MPTPTPTPIADILARCRDSGCTAEWTLYWVLKELADRGELDFSTLLDWSPDRIDWTEK